MDTNNSLHMDSFVWIFPFTELCSRHIKWGKKNVVKMLSIETLLLFLNNLKSRFALLIFLLLINQHIHQYQYIYNSLLADRSAIVVVKYH